MYFVFFTGYMQAQVKLYEGFEGEQFPPVGWSLYNDQNEDSEWKSINTATRIGTGCAVSNFSPTYSRNYLITKRIIPAEFDSLVFYFKQTFYNVFQDTLKVLLSNTDSLHSSMTTQIASYREGLNYPAFNLYSRVAISLNQYSNQTIWIAFVHSNTNGENIRIDEVSVGKSAMYDAELKKNIFPEGNIGICTYPYFVPKAVLKNSGLNNIDQPFNITYSITGAENFTSVRQTTILAGTEKEISFDTLFAFQDTGRYFVKIFTSLENDQYRINDTLYSEFVLKQNNFSQISGQYSGYHYSNSSACSQGALSLPSYCRKDTSGSINLMLNSTVLNSEIFSGNKDDGFFSIGGIFLRDKKIKFNNEIYDSVFVSTNGLIGFSRNNLLMTGRLEDMDLLINDEIPFIAPLWMNFDLGNVNVPLNRISYKVLNQQLIINYDRLPLKNGGVQDYVSFQAVIELVNQSENNSSFLFQYSRENSGSAFINRYLNRALPDHITGVKNNSGFLFYRKFVGGAETNSAPLFNESLALKFGISPYDLDAGCKELQISVMTEAILSTYDTVNVSIAYSENPGTMIETKEIVLTGGTGNCLFTCGEEESHYYLVIKHKNSIQVWSSDNTLAFTENLMNYDFTTDTSMAFGNNLKMVQGKACLYSGDVNQDGIIDGIDITTVANSVILSVPNYLTDLNGDGITDGSDQIIVENNAKMRIEIIVPNLSSTGMH